MPDFDYKAAHDELAAPGFNDLMKFPEVANAFKAVVDRADSLTQNSDLLVPMTDELKPFFDQIDTGILAAASRIIYFAGHWAYGGWSNADPFRKGAHWKFSNLADQVLQKRLGLRVSKRGNGGSGVDYTILEGIIRVEISTPDCFGGIEVGPATPANLKTAMEAEPADDYPYNPKHSRAGTRRDRDEWYDRMKARAKGIKASIGPWDGLLTGWDNTDRFMK